MTILHQHMAGVAELGFLARTLARQQRFRVGRGLVGEVAAPLAVKVHARIARIVVLRRGLRGLAIFALETLVPGPCFNQRAVNREVLVGEQAPLAGLRQHAAKKASATSPLSRRSRFLVNTVTSHTGSSILSPTNQRNRKL